MTGLATQRFTSDETAPVSLCAEDAYIHVWPPQQPQTTRKFFQTAMHPHTKANRLTICACVSLSSTSKKYGITTKLYVGKIGTHK